ncbi:MAG: serine hydrolase [Bacteroidota bacterium]
MPRRLVLSLLALAALTLAPLTYAQEVSEQIDAYLTASSDYGLFNGTVLVADGGEVIYEKGFGHADMTWDIPNTPETRFRIASLTKQFTAALVLRLVEAGRLDLDAPISTYLPDYPAAQAENVTLHHLLSHTGGVPEHTSRPDLNEIMRQNYEPIDFLAFFAEEPLDFEPGSQFAYSNSGYYLLGVIIETVTGRSYASALQEVLLDPLGLDATTYDPFPEIAPQMAHGYMPSGLNYVNAPYLDTSVPYAAGMLISTARDLFTWTEALHGGEVFDNAETLTRMTTPVLDDYAYGLGVSTLPFAGGVRAIAHSGGIPGFSTMLIHFPEDDRTVVVLDNTQGSAGSHARSLAGLLYGQPVPPPRQPVGRAVAERIESEGLDAAVAFYRSLRAGDASGYSMAEDELNALGYAYLGRGEIETAVRIFELNVEAYPDAFNPHDSLGEAYLAAGDTERGIASYQRSLELNPANDNARGVLERLGADATVETVEVPVETLDRYVGDYALQPSFIISVSRDGSTLYAEATGQPQVELVPSSQTQFYVTEVEAQITFVVEGDGPAPSLILNQGGQTLPAPRVE